MLHIGFTGSSSLGLSHERMTALRVVCSLLTRQGVLHHGDCIGADANAHIVAQESGWLGWRVEIHPPSDPRKRAFCRAETGDVLHPVKPYLVRNRHIVEQSAVLIVAPKSIREELRSGTWATVRYARTLKRPIIFIWPDASISIENRAQLEMLTK